MARWIGLLVATLLVLTGCTSTVSVKPGGEPMPTLPSAEVSTTAAPTRVSATPENVQQAIQKLRQVAQDDLDQAIALATAHKDVAAIGCFTALKAYLPKPGEEAGLAFPKLKGVFSAYEALRLGLAKDPGPAVPQELHIACAPLVLDAEVTLVRLGVIATGAAGGNFGPAIGAGGGLLKGLLSR